jgi:hypothetical protein
VRIDPGSQRSMAGTIATSAGRAPLRHLMRAVMELAGPSAELIHHSEKAWASATFSGARHTISLGFGGAAASEAAEHFITALPDHEFVVPGWLVADATIVSVDQRVLPSPHTLVEAELLVLDER